jgi:hypothetical protein
LSPLGLSNATGEDQQPPAGSSLTANAGPQLPPAPTSSVHENQASPAASQIASPELLRGEYRRLRSRAGTVATGDEGPSLPAASLGQDHERQQSLPALQSADAEAEGSVPGKRKKNKGAAPSSPLVKHRRVDLDVNSTSPGRRRSNRERRLTAKAAEDG